ncbi:T9SS type A sorting domain-containing protein [Candidatus Falkowbacteria bacterium]|nr:MAG: T9SS type A sorting domain-containing protein [Candidatus Falkowbacteria bacterium]
MKKISFLILSVIFILGSIGSKPIQSQAAKTFIKNDDCVERDTSTSEDFRYIKVAVKVMLAGAFNPYTGRMHTKLFESNRIPQRLTDTNFFDTKYPWQLKWIDFADNCFEQDIVTSQMVDFIQVILVDNPYNPTEMHWRLARLDSSGNIRDFNNKEKFLKFSVNPEKDYYICVVHRNHNGVMSSTPIQTDTAISTYDFTSDVNKIWGGYFAAVQMIDGTWCMIPGDVAGPYTGFYFGKGDHFVDDGDRRACLNDTGKIEVYDDTDCNLNSEVDIEDARLAEYFYCWGSGIPFCVANGEPWQDSILINRVIDYNMNGRIDSYDKQYQKFAKKNPFVFPFALDYNADGKFDMKDRMIGRTRRQIDSPLELPTYTLKGGIVQSTTDSIVLDVYLKSTGTRFEYNGSQYIAQIDTAQFYPTSMRTIGDFIYNNQISPSGIVVMSATAPNNGVIVISDTGDGTEIARIIIKGQRRGSGNPQQLITWRNEVNPFTKIFAVYQNLHVNITTPETHFIFNTTTSVGNSQTVLPKDFKLTQNYPNPFNPSTKINYELPSDGIVSIKLFNVSGKEVATLVNEVKTAGYYTVTFNASNLPSGAYFYRLEAESFIETKKMLLIK